MFQFRKYFFMFKSVAANITWVESEIHDNAAKIRLPILHEAYDMKIGNRYIFLILHGTISM
jgi:hypothetical protein